MGTGYSTDGYDTRSINYVLKYCATGDLILMQGRSPFSSLIRCMTRAPWTHVAVIYRESWKDRKGVTWEGPFVLQSILTNEGYWDYLTGTRKSGVQLNSLKEVLEKNLGKTFWRRLSYFGSSPNISESQSRAIVKNIGKPYEQNFFDLIKPLYQKKEGKGGEESFFCSELVIEFYDRAGFVTHKYSHDTYGPADFAGRHLSIFEIGYSWGSLYKVVENQSK